MLSDFHSGVLMSLCDQLECLCLKDPLCGLMVFENTVLSVQAGYQWFRTDSAVHFDTR